MKSKEALDRAEVEKLIQGIGQISFSKKNQGLIEKAMMSNLLLKKYL
jgi:hypothetical protein